MVYAQNQPSAIASHPAFGLLTGNEPFIPYDTGTLAHGWLYGGCLACGPSQGIGPAAKIAWGKQWTGNGVRDSGHSPSEVEHFGQLGGFYDLAIIYVTELKWP